MKQYRDLNDLLAGDTQAAKLFAQIPQYAKDQIMARGGHVNTADELEAYIHNILRGDG